MKASLQRSYSHIVFQASRLGWPGGLGAALLLAALVADVAWLAPQVTAVAVQQSAAARRALLPAHRAAPARPLQRQQVEIVLPRLFRAARQAGLRLDEGRYAQSGAQTGEPGGRRLRIDLPLSGHYPALRRFLAQVLNDNPALVLERLDLRRDSIESAELEARFSLVLNLEAER